MPEELKNALGHMHWGNWVQGLVVAILGGAADYLVIQTIMPGVAWRPILTAALFMGIKQGVLFLKSTPIPVLLTQGPDEQTVVVSPLVKVTDVPATEIPAIEQVKKDLGLPR